MYGSWCWAVDRKMEQIMNVAEAEMKMSRWMSGVIRKDSIQNECKEVDQNAHEEWAHFNKRTETDTVKVVNFMYLGVKEEEVVCGYREQRTIYKLLVQVKRM